MWAWACSPALTPPRVRVRDLSGSTSQRGVGARDLSGATHGADRPLELIGVTRVDAREVSAGEFVVDTQVVAGVGNTHVGVVAGELAGDTYVVAVVADTHMVVIVGDTHVGVSAREFVGNAPVGVALCELSGIGRGTVWRSGGDTVHWHILGVAATHLDDCGIEFDELAVRVLKAAPAVFTLSHD
jgi:hypothetical protein